MTDNGSAKDSVPDNQLMRICLVSDYIIAYILDSTNKPTTHTYFDGASITYARTHTPISSSH